MQNKNITQETGLLKRREPLNFMLGLAFIGTSILFGIIILIYISRRNVNDWQVFSLPHIFWISTLVIALSSYTLHQAYQALKIDDFVKYRYMLGSTLVLGIAFCLMQISGWVSMMSTNINFKNIAGAFLYLISGLHLLHIVGGLIFIMILFKEALKYKKYIDAFVYSVNPPNQLKIKLIVRYWHFVDILWIGLFLFLAYQHSV
jgi:cytochrome c oxidase subunit 3